MPITVHCPGCKSTLQVADQFAGRKGRCKKCQAVFPIPAASSPEEPPEVLPVEQPARADLDQGLQTTPGRVKRPVLQDDDDATPRRKRPAPRDEEGDTPRRRRPRSVDAQPTKRGVPPLVVGAVAAFLLMAVGTGAALWWFLRPRPTVDAAAKAGAPADTNPPAALANANPPAAVAVNDLLQDVAPAAAPGVVPVERPVAPARGVRPPAPDAPREVRPLPSTVADVAVGGGGRYLVLHLPQTRKLAIFDVHEARITRQIPLASEEILFTAGMTKLVVFMKGQNLLQRWDLATGQREATVPVAAARPVEAVVLGSASEGPVLVVHKRDRFSEDVDPPFLDLQTLKALPVKSSGPRRPPPGLNDYEQWRASADGRTFALRSDGNGVFTMVLLGDRVQRYYDRNDAGHLLPSPDGRVVYSATGMFSPEVKENFNILLRTGPYCLPATQGDLYLTLDGLPTFDEIRESRENPGLAPQKKPPTVHIHLAGNTQSLVQRNDLELPEGINPWALEALGYDKRLFLFPAAKWIITIPTSNDRLVLHRFDLDEVLDKSGTDYLLVTSQAPASARRGADYAYQIVVKSKKGGVRYRLDSGPPGMALSPTGRLSWRVPADLAGAADVIVSVGDAGGREVFHTFKVTPSDRADPAVAANVPPGPAPTARANGPAVEAVKPPTALTLPKAVHPLPAKVADAAVGGGGRYLILHLPQQQKLAIFDVNAGQIVRNIEAPGADVKFTAGLTKLVVALAEKKAWQRWDLATAQLEATAPLSAGGPVVSLAMGCASEGPILVSRQPQPPEFGAPLRFDPKLTFRDLRSLNILSIVISNDAMQGGGLHGAGHCRASADGTTFAMWHAELSPQGIYRMVVRGDEAKAYYEHGDCGHLQPSPDGRVIYSGCGVIPTEAEELRPGAARAGPFCLPAVQGDFYLTVPGLEYGSPFATKGRAPAGPGPKKLQAAAIHRAGDFRPLIQLNDLELPERTDPLDPKVLGPDKRLFLIPAANVLITIPMTNDRLVLHRINLDEALERSGTDYLFVTSRAPATVKRGTTFTYQLTVKSKKGGVTSRLEAGPPGMQVSQEGRVTWQVPATWSEAAANVVLSVRDASGQEVFHTFTIANSDKPAPAEPRISQPEAPGMSVQDMLRRYQDPNLKPEEKAALRKQIQDAAKKGAPRIKK